MKMIKVESSNIHAIGHESGVLRVEFKDKNGVPTGSYDYKNFLPEDYAALSVADSKGRHFARKIKGAFDSEKVEFEVKEGWIAKSKS